MLVLSTTGGNWFWPTFRRRPASLPRPPVAEGYPFAEQVDSCASIHLPFCAFQQLPGIWPWG